VHQGRSLGNGAGKIELRTWLVWRAADERSAALLSLREMALSLSPRRTRRSGL
jgi:hypothetical protein